MGVFSIYWRVAEIESSSVVAKSHIARGIVNLARSIAYVCPCSPSSGATCHLLSKGRRGAASALKRLHPPKSAAREHPPVAADDHDLELGRRAGDDARGRRPCALGDERRQVEAGALRKFERMEPAVGACDRLSERRPAPGFRDARGESREIDRAAPRMQIELALGELRHLRRAAGDGDARDWADAQVFEQPAGEIAHLDQ